jgi:hypothetical protein
MYVAADVYRHTEPAHIPREYVIGSFHWFAWLVSVSQAIYSLVECMQRFRVWLLGSIESGYIKTVFGCMYQNIY